MKMFEDGFNHYGNMQWKLITKKNQSGILNVTSERMFEWYTQ